MTFTQANGVMKSLEQGVKTRGMDLERSRRWEIRAILGFHVSTANWRGGVSRLVAMLLLLELKDPTLGRRNTKGLRKLN